MNNFIQKFVQTNRGLVRGFKTVSAALFGEIDDCERYFYSRIQCVEARRIIEIGGADRPLFSKVNLDEYIGVDIDKSFNWEGIYSKYYAQSWEDCLPDRVEGDLVVSKYVLEHISDNVKSFKNIGKTLSKEGFSIHLIPLGFHPFSIANRLVGNRLARVFIPILRPGTERETGYPAYYNLCNSFQLERVVKNLGFQYDVKYFYGAEDYFGFFFPFGFGLHLFNRIACIFGMKIFASNAVISIWKHR
jgi:hypothetical protein